MKPVTGRHHQAETSCVSCITPMPVDQPITSARSLFPELKGLWDDPSETVVDLADDA